jgi:Ca-activated chloride channel family protein
MIPDDPTAMVLLAASANGLGKLEEAVRWLEKGGQAGSPDVAQGPHATARAFAALFLAWGRMDAKAAGRTDEWKALAARLDKVTSGEKREGQVRVLLSWSHPELHPALWTNTLGTMMPAAEGDVTLGLSQALIADRGGTLVEIRVEPSELEHAARLGAKAILTIVFSEGKDVEVIDKREITFEKTKPTQRFRIEGGRVDAVAVDPTVEKKP